MELDEYRFVKDASKSLMQHFTRLGKESVEIYFYQINISIF